VELFVVNIIAIEKYDGLNENKLMEELRQREEVIRLI